MDIVDSHHHFWDPGRYRYPWMNERMDAVRRPFGPEDLLPEARASGVSQTVVVQTLHDERETLELLAIADESELVAGVVGWVDLCAPNVEEQVARLRDSPGGDHLVGIRHLVHEEGDPDWLRRTDVRRGLEVLSRLGLPFDLLIRARELPAAIDVARTLPDLRLIIDHVAKPDVRRGGDRAWANGIQAIGACENVSCKVSGLVTETGWDDWTFEEFVPVIERASEVFGFDRLLFGSDWPVCLLAASYAQVVQITEHALSGISPEERRRFYAVNARRFYRLPEPGVGE